MGVFNQAANLAQRGVVLGLVSFFGYQVYQIGRNVSENKVESKYMETKTFDKIQEKIREEEKFKNDIDKIPDRYDADDDSYLKKVPKLNK